MGQAKQRGTFEQRKAEGIAKRRAKEAKRIVRKVSARGVLALAIGASLAGAVHWWPK